MRRHWHGDRGAVAIEFALVLPLLFALLLGIIDFGFVFNGKISVTNAAAEGARVLALGGSSDEVEQRVQDALVGSGQVLPVDVDVTPCAPGEAATVRVEGSVHTILPVPDVTVAAQGVMACTG